MTELCEKFNMCEGSVIVVNCPVPDPSTTYKQVLHLVDILLSSFVIGPLVIAAWRGIWNLADIYLFPDDGIDSALASIVIGLVGYMLFMLPQKLICDSFNRDKHRITFYIFSRLYTFIFAVISVLGCRGPWNLVDLLTPYEPTWINLLTVAAVVLLIVTKSLANVNAAPFLITTDEHEDYFLINTRFKTSVSIKCFRLKRCYVFRDQSKLMEMLSGLEFIISWQSWYSHIRQCELFCLKILLSIQITRFNGDTD